MTQDRLRTAGLERRLPLPISDDRSISWKLVLPQCNDRETIRLGSSLVTRRVSVNRIVSGSIVSCGVQIYTYIYIYTHIHTKYVAKVIRAEWKPIMRTSSRGDR